MSYHRRISNFIVGLVLAAPLATAGCSNTCGTNCPAAALDIFATPGENLNTTGASWTGPACPTYPPVCWSDDGINPCTAFEIEASAAGTCDLTVTFSDGRPTFVAHGDFGPATTVGCCHGFPTIGPAQVFIPPIDGGAATDAGATDADAGAVDAPGAN